VRLDEAHFAVFDVETTGLYPYSGDRICEIAAVRHSPGAKRLRKFHSLVDPQRKISGAAFAVNGITEEMVKGKPRIADVLPAFLRFIEGSVLVAYNAGFDLGFIECALGQKDKLLGDYYVIDALKLARRLFKGLGRYNLGYVSHALGIDPLKEHRALSDAEMTWQLFRKEVERLRAEGVLNVEEIASFGRKPGTSEARVKDYKMAAIERAIREEKRLNITYRSAWTNSFTNRVVTPKEVREGYDRWYLIAHCHKKNAERNFRIDCIVDLEVVR
jgi:DNA polymerase III epsilon subunit family exonuclease